MNTLAALIISATWTVPTGPPSPEERAVVYAALECPLNTKADPWLLLRVFRATDHQGLPWRVRVMLLGSACAESAYNPRAIGRDAEIGLFQILPAKPPGSRYSGHALLCGAPDLTHPEGSARCYAWRVATTYQKAKRCPRPWITAEGWVARGGGHYRCTRIASRHVEYGTRFFRESRRP